MTQIIRRVSLLFLLALLTSTTILFAQDTDSSTIVGSGIVNSIVESLAEAHETDTITITTTGTPVGFEQFCAGNADAVTATRAISADEDANCISNEVVYSEFLVAHSILAFAVNPSVSFLECLTTNDLNTFFTPSATGQLTNWTGYDETLDDLPITFILPQDDTVEYVILDNMVDGDGLRRDSDTYSDLESAVSQVSDTEGAIAVIPFSTDLIANESIRLLDVNYNTTTGCSSPSIQNAEYRLYTASQQMFMYVNRASLDSNESLQEFLGFTTTIESAEVIEGVGYVAPSDEAYMLNADILANAAEGRQFSGTESDFVIPDNLIGQIDINGAANAYSLLNNMAGQLTSINQQLTINTEIEGQTAGIRRLCNGETDIAILESELDDSGLDGCEANDINTIPIPIGSQATVLVANTTDTFATCLTTEQLNTIWGAGSSNTISNWSDADTAFPDQDMTLFGLSTSNQYSDIMLQTLEGPIEPIRRDTELSNNPLYRAAAVGNVQGSLTYMSWTDYLRVLGNNQQNIQLVSIDNGSDCVLPSKQTITDGTYPLSRPASLLVNEASLTDISVQSYLWSLFSDQGWTVIEREGFIGIDFGDLLSIRSELETQFSLAEANVVASASSPDAESTAEPDSDESTDATDESTESDESEENAGD
jgi:ABC-type phosphate transport system substrate-binding protein